MEPLAADVPILTQAIKKRHTSSMGSACGPLEALSSTSSSSTHSDDIGRVLSSAPWWLYSTTWKLAKPENVGAELSTFKVTGPVSSDEMMQLYRAKKLKGSVLMAGLTQAAKDMRPQEIPASLYRTLAHLFEMSRNGVPYSPVDPEAARSGLSAASWARPLWTICEPSLPNGVAARAGGSPDSELTQSSTGGGSSAGDSCDSSDTTAMADGRSSTPPVDEPDLTVRLLKSAPMWCYLYSHEPLKSKKTPPKSSDHMVHMYRSGCLPEWTPMLGLQRDVAHFNSLPPSLFTTLGALVSVMQAGLELQPVGLVELQRYDKFIEQRNHVGSTMRSVPSVESLSRAQSAALRGGRPRGSLASAKSTPTDNLSRALSSLPPLGSRNPTASTTPASCNSSVTSATARAPPPSRSPAPSPWSVPHHSAAGSGAVDSSVDAAAAAAQAAAGAVPPYGMAMPMYPAMMPWMWGMSHMPYTMLPSPTQPSAGGASMANGRSSPSTPSVSRRTTGNTHRSNAGGGRVGMAHGASPGSSCHRGQYQATPSRAAPPGESPQTPASPLLVSPGMGTPGAHPMLMPMVADPSAAAAAMQAGMWPWGMPATGGMPGMPGLPGATSWSTSVFKLFMADTSRGLGQPVWWYYDPRQPTHVVGPVPAESMILAYASGNITPHHYLCGTRAEVTAACPPAKEFFEDLGSLLQQIESGGDYMLVSLEEVTEHAKRASAAGASGPRQGGGRGRRNRNAASSAGTSAFHNAPVPPRTPTSMSSPRQETIASSSGDMGHAASCGEQSEASSQSVAVSPLDAATRYQQMQSQRLSSQQVSDEALFASSAATAAAAAAAAVVSLLDRSDSATQAAASADGAGLPSPRPGSRARSAAQVPAVSVPVQAPVANGPVTPAASVVNKATPATIQPETAAACAGKTQGAQRPINGLTAHANGVAHLANGVSGSSSDDEPTQGEGHARQQPDAAAAGSSAAPADAVSAA